jgi:hypothetical protein
MNRHIWIAYNKVSFSYFHHSTQYKDVKLFLKVFYHRVTETKSCGRLSMYYTVLPPSRGAAVLKRFHLTNEIGMRMCEYENTIKETLSPSSGQETAFRLSSFHFEGTAKREMAFSETSGRLTFGT